MSSADGIGKAVVVISLLISLGLFFGTLGLGKGR